MIVFYTIVLLLAPLVFAVGLYFCRSVKLRCLFVVLLICSSVVLLGWCSLLTWFFRDGLGPGMVSSTGWLAWQRFAEDFTKDKDLRVALVYLAAVVVIGYFGARASRSRIKPER